jgi:anthranilate 1,2-dioxygenase small subunit
MNERHLWLRLELMSLQDTYISAIDTDKLEDWPALFVEDCLYEIVSKENEKDGLPAPVIYCDSAAMLRDRVLSLRHANIYETQSYRHFLSGLQILTTSTDTVKFSCGYLVINTGLDGVSSIYQTGIYYDTVVRTDDGWRFKVKRVIYDTSRVQTLLAYPI